MQTAKSFLTLLLAFRRSEIKFCNPLACVDIVAAGTSPNGWQVQERERQNVGVSLGLVAALVWSFSEEEEDTKTRRGRAVFGSGR